MTLEAEQDGPVRVEDQVQSNIVSKEDDSDEDYAGQVLRKDVENTAALIKMSAGSKLMQMP
jgi:hypothetical protein